MLAGTLGDQLLERVPSASRFVDLFAGSGAVSRFISTRVGVPTVGVDLMRYSGVLTAATNSRTKKLDFARVWRSWEERADEQIRPHQRVATAAAAISQPMTEADVLIGRSLCKEPIDGAFIWSDYGGYYFSPEQALELSAFYAALPTRAPSRTVALAALLQTASKASASPGHTAQPFRPTERLLPHLRSAWRVDVRAELFRQLKALSSEFALAKGTVHTGDSLEFVKKHIGEGDLVFCDPPYSAAQYSRFYHVLEGIAVGGWQRVLGAGRASGPNERLSSDFSRKTKANTATADLIASLAAKGATVLWTYPEGDRSNGLNVDAIRQSAKRYYSVAETRIPMRHSTLGGSLVNHKPRPGRRDLHEVLFLFEPR